MRTEGETATQFDYRVVRVLTIGFFPIAARPT
jgi:hypothetical protein